MFKFIKTRVMRQGITSKFTCPNFLRAVREKLGKGTNEPILATDVAGITWLDVSCRNICSLDGIEYFTALSELTASANQLTELDVSKNTALLELSVPNNLLVELDVSANLLLTNLQVPNNQLTKLDISANSALTWLFAGNNRLTKLNVSKNAALTYLDVRYNYIKSQADIIGLEKTKIDIGEFNLGRQETKQQ